MQEIRVPLTKKQLKYLIGLVGTAAGAATSAKEQKRAEDLLDYLRKNLSCIE